MRRATATASAATWSARFSSSRNRSLRSRFPWFDDEVFGDERDAARVPLSAEQKEQLKNFQSVLQGFVLTDLDRYTTAGRHPPSETDCKVLAFGEVKKAVVVTDDLGMHLLAGDFDIPIWHGWELLSKMRAAKKIDNDR